MVSDGWVHAGNNSVLTVGRLECGMAAHFAAANISKVCTDGNLSPTLPCVCALPQAPEAPTWAFRLSFSWPYSFLSLLRCSSECQHLPHTAILRSSLKLPLTTSAMIVSSLVGLPNQSRKQYLSFSTDLHNTQVSAIVSQCCLTCTCVLIRSNIIKWLVVT